MFRVLLLGLGAALLTGVLAVSPVGAQAPPEEGTSLILPLPPFGTDLLPPCAGADCPPPTPPLTEDELSRLPQPGDPNPLLDFGLIPPPDDGAPLFPALTSIFPTAPIVQFTGFAAQLDEPAVQQEGLGCSEDPDLDYDTVCEEAE